MRLALASLLMLCAGAALAQMPPPSAPASAPPASANAAGVVTVSGTMPNQATKAEVLDRLRQLYGANRVVDNVSIGDVVAPAHWNRDVTSMIGPNLKLVSHGKIEIHGNAIAISGEVPNEAVRQQVLSGLANNFDGSYGIKQTLRIGQSGQKLLDTTLAGRTIQFESGSAVLSASGEAILNQMASAIQKLHDPMIAIIGNTDNVGDRASNIQLSLTRANAVKAYLVSKGIPAGSLSVSGQGPDDPIASNTTDAGRAQNRRTDFHIISK